MWYTYNEVEGLSLKCVDYTIIEFIYYVPREFYLHVPTLLKVLLATQFLKVMNSCYNLYSDFHSDILPTPLGK